MLHLRVLAPADLREPILHVLEGQPGVAHVVLLPGAAVDPAGDQITADVAREAADDVVQRLKSLDVQHYGAITLEPLDTVLSSAAYHAEDVAGGDGADAVIWDELVSRTREESSLSVTYLMFLCIACLLAAIGVVTDSAITVVGAMVVGPEFGPLAALAVALVQRRMSLARRAGAALLVGFPLAMVVTAVATLCFEALGWVQLTTFSELTEVDFIFQVGPFSFVVALLAGAAGMLSLVSSKSEALVGVFISVTTVPAAGFAVVAATVGDWGVAANSVLQLLVNLLGITMAGVLTLAVYRRATVRRAVTGG
ncbi:hypothetical protein A5717_24255 [Mycolicibacterium porcinum]|uniref:DUF389 domain-containing protein n=1 Tax=Mycolicibacterium porcinum TaxID=39693 RepID=UPI00080B3F8E|nr:DUF389 domain-containing protein [Mycolicibacterium porcinum]OCB10177.1 hypothetical protein A5717_24255 [Mycolicibacterium porcinum]